MNTQTQPTTNTNTTRSTPRRRMRRTGRARCPQRAASPSPNEKCNMLDAQCSMNSPSVPPCLCGSDPSSPSASSAPSALNPSPSAPPIQKSETINQKSKRPRARPFQTLPEFAALNRDQLAYIHDILRTKTLEDAQREIWTELGLQHRLDLCTLHRYKHKLLFAESLDLVDDAITTATAVDQLNDLLAGRPTKLSATGLQVVQQRALALANDPATKPSLFTNLHRIFTYEDRKAERDRTHAFRVEQAAQLNTHRAALQSTREKLTEDKIAMNAHRKMMDLEKLKLAQARLALDNRKQDHREKPANDIWTDESQRQMSEQMDAFLAGGRAYLAQEREKEAACQQAQSSAAIPGGAHSTLPHSQSNSSVDCTPPITQASLHMAQATNDQSNDE